jgi:hypothetical protein
MLYGHDDGRLLMMAGLLSKPAHDGVHHCTDNHVLRHYNHVLRHHNHVLRHHNHVLRHHNHVLRHYNHVLHCTGPGLRCPRASVAVHLEVRPPRASPPGILCLVYCRYTVCGILPGILWYTALYTGYLSVYWLSVGILAICRYTGGILAIWCGILASWYTVAST